MARPDAVVRRGWMWAELAGGLACGSWSVMVCADDLRMFEVGGMVVTVEGELQR